MITGNEPTNPCSVLIEGGEIQDMRQDSEWTAQLNGETLRMKWAAQIMAALNTNNYSRIPQEVLATRAVAGADALITALNAPKLKPNGQDAGAEVERH